MAFYFSKHDCAPCLAFTPILVELYNEINQDEKVLEVIFFSADQTIEEFNKYFETMPWFAIKKDDECIKKVAKNFNVRGVPRLVMLNGATGDVLDEDCL